MGIEGPTQIPLPGVSNATDSLMIDDGYNLCIENFSVRDSLYGANLWFTKWVHKIGAKFKET